MKKIMLLLMLPILCSSCSKEDGPVDPPQDVYTIEIISGNNQTAPQTTQLDEPVVIEVTNQEGLSQAGIEITVEISTGGGAILNENLITNENGRLDILWQLGPDAVNEILIYIAGDEQVSVSASATSTNLYIVPEQVNDGWPVQSLNLYTQSIDNLLDGVDAIKEGNYGEVHSLLIVHEGNLVFEEYFPGHDFNNNYHEWMREMPHEVQSASKSIRSMFIGIAIDKGFIPNVDEKLFSFFPEHAQFNTGEKDDITLEHVLTMTSGFEWEEWDYIYGDPRNTLTSYYENEYEGWLPFVLSRPLSDTPGTRFEYNTGASIMLNNIIINSIDITFEQFVRNYYCDLTETERIPATGAPLNFNMTPRDMAKFGQVYLSGGMWKANRVVSEEWIEESLSGHVTVSGGRSYGYQWWMRESGFGADSHEIKYAVGNGGQYVMLIQDLDLVVVFTGGNFNNTLMDRPLNFLSYYIIPLFQ